MSNIIVLRDGNEVASATLGFSRPDVTSAFPDAPLDTGFQASLDTAKVLQCHTFAHGKRNQREWSSHNLADGPGYDQ